MTIILLNKYPYPFIDFILNIINFEKIYLVYLFILLIFIKSVFIKPIYNILYHEKFYSKLTLSFANIFENKQKFSNFISFLFLFSKILLCFTIVIEMINGYFFYTIPLFYFIFTPLIFLEILLFLAYYIINSSFFII